MCVFTFIGILDVKLVTIKLKSVEPQSVLSILKNKFKSKAQTSLPFFMFKNKSNYMQIQVV